MKYFANVFTLEELKKQYRKLALIHHPDRGGNEKDFIDLKNEYDQLFSRLNRKGNQNTSHSEQQEYYEETNNFKEIIDDLINFDDIDIEIIGSWVWVTGKTFTIKDKLKTMGFKYASGKKAWYYHEGEYKKFHKKNFTMDELREMHINKKVKKGNGKKALTN